MEKITPFITSLWIDHLDVDKTMSESVLFLKNTDQMSITKSNRGGWQSKPFAEHDLKITENLINSIKSKVKIVYEELGITQQPILKNYWFNCNSKNNFNLEHVHPYSFVSAVFYISTSLDCGKIIFKRPDNFENFIESSTVTIDTIDNYRFFFIEPTDGMLIIFPSYLPHYVESSHSDKERISMSFNFA